MLLYQGRLVQWYFLFAGNGTEKAPSNATLDRRATFVRFDLRPTASGFEFEALVDIHAARRTAVEPAVRMSRDSV